MAAELVTGAPGTYHMRHRVYQADEGRWTRRDPIGYHDGMNLYEYVGSGPVGRIDPIGLCSVSPAAPAAYVSCMMLGAGAGANTYQIAVHLLAAGLSVELVRRGGEALIAEIMQRIIEGSRDALADIFQRYAKELQEEIYHYMRTRGKNLCNAMQGMKDKACHVGGRRLRMGCGDLKQTKDCQMVSARTDAVAKCLALRTLFALVCKEPKYHQVLLTGGRNLLECERIRRKACGEDPDDRIKENIEDPLGGEPVPFPWTPVAGGCAGCPPALH